MLRPVPELTGTTVPDGPTILARGVFYNGVHEHGGWWVEGPEGASGTTVTADPVDEVEAPITEQTVERLRIHFTAGDLPGRYVFHYGYSENETMTVDVTE